MPHRQDDGSVFSILPSHKPCKFSASPLLSEETITQHDYTKTTVGGLVNLVQQPIANLQLSLVKPDRITVLSQCIGNGSSDRLLVFACVRDERVRQSRDPAIGAREASTALVSLSLQAFRVQHRLRALNRVPGCAGVQLIPCFRASSSPALTIPRDKPSNHSVSFARIHGADSTGISPYTSRNKARTSSIVPCANSSKACESIFECPFSRIPLLSTPRAERLASSFFLSRTMRSLIASRRPVMVTPTSRSNSGSGFQLMTESGSTCHLIGLLG